MERFRRYDATHKDRSKERHAEWYRKNREIRKAYHDIYYAANRERLIKYTRDWIKANPDRVRAGYAQHRARRKSKMVGLSKSDLAVCRKIVAAESKKKVHQCYYCKKRFLGEFHIDHVTALNKGGKHESSNLAVSCPSCNMSKRDKAVDSLVVNGQRLLNI